MSNWHFALGALDLRKMLSLLALDNSIRKSQPQMTRLTSACYIHLF